MRKQSKSMLVFAFFMAFIAIGLFFAGMTRTVHAEPPGEIPPAGCNVCEELATIDTNLGMINEKLDKMPPTRSQILPASERFELVMGDEAVLDKETGLVWEQSPDTILRDWHSACSYCYNRVVGDRKGWRLPTVEELASLIDMSGTGLPTLPSGYEAFFSNVQLGFYWSSTTGAAITSIARGVLLAFGHVGWNDKDGNGCVWCVRGGYGHDAY